MSASESQQHRCHILFMASWELAALRSHVSQVVGVTSGGCWCLALAAQSMTIYPRNPSGQAAPIKSGYGKGQGKRERPPLRCPLARL